jgi:hypothetical protein
MESTKMLDWLNLQVKRFPGARFSSVKITPAIQIFGSSLLNVAFGTGALGLFNVDVRSQTRYRR